MTKLNFSPDTSPLNFGKYRGSTPEHVATVDPGYLVWAYENVGKHVCSRSLYVAASDAADRERDEDRDEYFDFGAADDIY